MPRRVVTVLAAQADRLLRLRFQWWFARLERSVAPRSGTTNTGCGASRRRRTGAAAISAARLNISRELQNQKRRRGGDVIAAARHRLTLGAGRRPARRLPRNAFGRGRRGRKISRLRLWPRARRFSRGGGRRAGSVKLAPQRLRRRAQCFDISRQHATYLDPRRPRLCPRFGELDRLMGRERSYSPPLHRGRLNRSWFAGLRVGLAHRGEVLDQKIGDALRVGNGTRCRQRGRSRADRDSSAR